ncbi:hypothetical protein M23134_05436 [Microscilla marina ATCC 23134]|uniref:Uncharacterized protein n=1 Tax=Microscilla marina ATCC 23134 TaxID=313606 RepID=A1ZHU6_MICM2|nr:hypothetical protein M23134_05436 [Microscilla marina ATCC 23134]
MQGKIFKSLYACISFQYNGFTLRTVVLSPKTAENPFKPEFGLQMPFIL